LVYETKGKKITINRGINTELSLVEKLCTDKQKESYQEAGRFTSGTNKKSFLTALSQYCEFEYNAETKNTK